MEKNKKGKRRDYNTVVEGCFHDDILNAHYALTKLGIPNEATVINDGVEKYRLYGRLDGLSFIKIKGKLEDLEAKVDDEMLPFILEARRAFFLKDGRVFVREYELKENVFWYLEGVPMMCAKAVELFHEKKATLK